MGLNDISALDVINKLSEKDLKSVIKILGEEVEDQKLQKILLNTETRKNY